jgi:hypothetical protein
MLRMRRTDDDQEIKMLTAMMDATARISAVARQASELSLLSVSEDGEPSTASIVAVPLSELVSRVASAQLPRPVAVAVPEAVAGSTVRTRQIEALSSAIAAIVVSLERNLPDRPVALRAAVAADGSPLLLVGDESDLASVQPDAATAEAEPSAAKLFEAGGQGLSLVLAAAVLDRHGISVGLLRSSSEIVVLRLPKE